MSSSVPIYTPGWREALWDKSVLPKNTTQHLRTALETSALAMRLARLPSNCNATGNFQMKLTFTASFQALWHESTWWKTHGSNWRQRDAPVTKWLHKRNQCSHTGTWYQHHSWAPLAEALCSQVHANFTLIELHQQKKTVFAHQLFWFENCQSIWTEIYHLCPGLNANTV